MGNRERGASYQARLEVICAALSMLASAPLLGACASTGPAPETEAPVEAEERCADGSCGGAPASFGSQRCSGFASCAGRPSVDCRREREGM